ncbi:MAG: Lrp/AsnC family transcriptional regulator [Burkholderiaceae bacterium]
MTRPAKLDRIDLSILVALQQNARLTNAALGERVGLSASPCLQRIRRLEKAGFIERYQAVIRLARILDYITVFTEVTLSDHRREDFIRFETGVRQYDTLRECHLVSGGYDYLLKFVARNVSHYQEIIESLLDSDLGVEKYFSYIVIKTIFEDSSLPVIPLMPAD